MPVASINAGRLIEANGSTWPRLATELGLPFSSMLGDRIETAPVAPASSGCVERLDTDMITVLLDGRGPVSA